MYQGGNQEFASPGEALTHISEEAWTKWTKADYTLEQWHNACIIHLHDGAPTSKSQCKVPVKTPTGVLNRAGIHAAAGALAGARGGVKGVSADQKTKAENALKRYYVQLGETPPDSLSHHGVKGMHWGVRNERDTTGRMSPSSAVELNSSTKAYMAAATSMQAEAAKWSSEKKAANVQKYREEFAKKFEPPGRESVPPSGKEGPGALGKAKEKWNNLSPDQKDLAIKVGVAGILVGGVLAYNAYGSRFSLPAAAYLPLEDNFKGKPGDLIKPGPFLARIGKSQETTYAVEDFFRPEAFARKSFELPAGSTFHRISSAAESGFSEATYCTSNTDDFNRYAVALGIGGTKRHHITFQSKSPVKVASLTEALDTVREEIGNLHGIEPKQVPESQVLMYYKGISHQQWKGAEPESLMKALRSKGFSAIVDEMDTGVFSDRPLVFFGKDTTPKKATVLKRADLKQIASQLKEINDPPGRAGYKLTKAGYKSLQAGPAQPKDLAAEVAKILDRGQPAMADFINNLPSEMLVG